jgi:hypothetical protein
MAWMDDFIEALWYLAFMAGWQGWMMRRALMGQNGP